jgi:single-strand selective monofunctional uracil DNA glycosylase
MQLVHIARSLTRRLKTLSFEDPVTHVYNPLEYAGESYAEYVRRYAHGTKEVILLGMNPGPWGMVQTGVPFGEVSAVRDWLGINARIKRPRAEHPKRPVLGLACRRSEVSGARLWGWARSTFGTPARFFARFFVLNYCPLAFFEESGRNRTPDKLPADERRPLLGACDRALRESVESLSPRFVIGVGRFAERRAREALHATNVQVGGILHPSPASPAANRNWLGHVADQLTALGINVPEQKPDRRPGFALRRSDPRRGD